MVGQKVFGTLHPHPRPAPRHAFASSRLGSDLDPPFARGRGGPGSWRLLFEPERHLGPHVLVPDLAGWRRERMPEMPVDQPFFALAPDWVCEVLSPSAAHLDRGDKLRVYGLHGVKHVRFVDPEAMTLEILEHDERGYRIVDIHGGDARVPCPSTPSSSSSPRSGSAEARLARARPSKDRRRLRWIRLHLEVDTSPPPRGYRRAPRSARQGCPRLVSLTSRTRTDTETPACSRIEHLPLMMS